MNHLFEKIKYNNKTDCWLWVGAINGCGYAASWNKKLKKQYRAHRLSYEYFIGKIPKRKELDHLCRVRHCVNPFHLEPVTRKENYIRGIGPQKSKEKWAKYTKCIHGHDMSDAHIYYQNGHKKRQCRKCNNIRTKEWIQRCKNRK